MPVFTVRSGSKDTLPKLKVGDLIDFFEDDDNTYSVKACDERFVICTCPHETMDTVWYTIIDFERDVRGETNLVFNLYDFTDQAKIDECLRDLQNGEIEVSSRRCIDLDIWKITN
jgi:hypothetical protein